MNHRTIWLAFALFAAMACARPQAAGPVGPVQAERAAPRPPGPIQHVVLMTIDGLMPDSYLHPDAHGLRVPTLRRFVAEGAVSEGALSTFPSVTYPAHTTIATGVLPARHGIISNHSFDPLGENRDAWFWYTEDLKVKPLWQRAYEAGYPTALVSWPVTVRAQATWLWPEYRAENADDRKLLRALATEGLGARLEQNYPRHAQRSKPPNLTDAAHVDVVSQVLHEGTPTLLMVHIFQVDSAQHRHGVWSPEASSAIENADTQLARVIEAVDGAGILASTAFVVASDHGFANITQQRNPNALLREAGLIQVDGQGKVRSWKASCLVSGAAAYVYVNGADPAVEDQVTELFRARAAAADSGIAHVWTRADIAARGGDPQALLALEAELGVTFGSLTTSFESEPTSAGMHGYDPERPEMKASLLMLGPSIPHGRLQGARLVDIAPTIAEWLGLLAPDFKYDGRPLAITPEAPDAATRPSPRPEAPAALQPSAAAH